MLISSSRICAGSTCNYSHFTFLTSRLLAFSKQRYFAATTAVGGQAYRAKYTMDKVFLRHQAPNEEVHISFRYINDDFQIDRNFNFCRKLQEHVADSVLRIKGSIEKEVQKKLKKFTKKKRMEPDGLKDDCNQPQNQISVEFLSKESEKKFEQQTFAELLAHCPNDLLLKIEQRKYTVSINEPWVASLDLPNLLMAGFMVYPSKLELQFADRNHCMASWYRAEMPSSGNLEYDAEWQSCGEGFYYNIAVKDIGYYLKFVIIPANDRGQYGPAMEQITKSNVQAGPGPIPYEIRHCFTPQSVADDTIRIVSYNILADLYADSDYSRKHLFSYCPAYALRIDYRKQLLLKELLGYNADVICLQEVDVRFFNSDLQTTLKDSQHCYSGLMAEKGNCGEGVATFYNISKFTLIETQYRNIGESIQTLPIFQQFWQKLQSNEKLLERISKRSTTLQCTLLQMNKTGQYLLIANTHLYFHPDADHIRLIQMGFAMLYLEDLYKNYIKTLAIDNEQQLAILFAGDFNSVPDCGIYRLMTEGYVPEDIIDWNSNSEECVKGISLQQPFRMQSACGTPAFTNYTPNFAACLDYIFYQSDRLSVEQIIPFPTEQQLKAHIAIPSVVFPSDHLALVADLKFKSNPNSSNL